MGEQTGCITYFVFTHASLMVYTILKLLWEKIYERNITDDMESNKH